MENLCSNTSALRKKNTAFDPKKSLIKTTLFHKAHHSCKTPNPLLVSFVIDFYFVLHFVISVTNYQNTAIRAVKGKRLYVLEANSVFFGYTLNTTILAIKNPESMAP
jgi:hypothetical protein